MGRNRVVYLAVTFSMLMGCSDQSGRDLGKHEPNITDTQTNTVPTSNIPPSETVPEQTIAERTATEQIPAKNTIETKDLLILAPLKAGREQGDISERDFQIMVALSNLDSEVVSNGKTVYTSSKVPDVKFTVEDGSAQAIISIRDIPASLEQDPNTINGKIRLEVTAIAKLKFPKFPIGIGAQAPTRPTTGLSPN